MLKQKRHPSDVAADPPRPRPTSARWLLLGHQLPTSPSNLRVRTWRRLQQLGAVALKQAVYVLPDSRSAREDFEWLRTEIAGAGGEATVFVANHIDSWTHDELVEEFRRARQKDYAQLAQDIARASKAVSRTRRGRPSTRPGEALRRRLEALDAIDFFGSAGRDRAVLLLERLESRLQPPSPRARSESAGAPRETYQDRLWITRPRPGIDRMASAWLIKRFVDAGARFDFFEHSTEVPKEAIPFDMFGVEFSHHQDQCTFETLVSVFAIADAAVTRIAAIVHDLDLKDARFGLPETKTVGTLVTGLQRAIGDDHALLAEGVTIFEAFYRAFQASRHAGPRLAATRRRRQAQP